jgi:diguanylate cyclase (GGDEF)-like protein
MHPQPNLSPQVDRLLEQDPPTAFSALARLIQSDASDFESVHSSIQTCPTLAARLLAVFRSPAFATRHQITSLRHAVVMLGSKQARMIAMGYAIKQVLNPDGGVPPEMLDRHWRSTLAKAEAARCVAESIRGADPEAAQTAALIQDLGLGRLLGIDADFYAALAERPIPTEQWLERERERFGLDHAELTVALLAKWQIGEGWIHAIRQHHRPIGEAEDGKAAVPRVTAAMLPHLNEPLDDASVQWLIAMHARFLYDKFSTPEAFLIATEAAVSTFVGDTEVPTEARVATMYHALCEQVASGLQHLCLHVSDLEATSDASRQNFDALRSAAFSDTLTRVLNRRGFMMLAHRRLEHAAAHHGACALMFIDINGLKQINDRYGHDAGDRLIRGMAKLLRRAVDRQDMIGRLGGDEFAVLITDVTREEAISICQRVYQVCDNKKIRVSEQLAPSPVRFSQGLCYAPRVTRTTDFDDLIKLADQAMYRAKQAKHNDEQLLPIELYTPPAPDTPI